MQEKLEHIIEKHRSKIQEAEEYFRKNDCEVISFSPERIKLLSEAGHFPKELWDYHCRSTQEVLTRRNFHQKIKKENPNLSSEELFNKYYPARGLSPEEIVKTFEDAALSSQMLMWLLKNRELLNENQVVSEKISNTLFQSIDLSEDMGIVLAITDSLYHLEKILGNMEYSQLYENMYVAKGSYTNSIGETIVLEYTFRASSKKDADDALLEYKKIMLKKGLRTWMAYWCTANEHGRTEYECKLVDIMKWMADEHREAYFQTKEKAEFWHLTRMLGFSKLSRSRIIRKRKKNDKEKEYVKWIEQPLIEVFGGERLLEKEDHYPDLVAVRVLMPKMNKKGFAPALYKLSTLKLNPNDIYLAFIIQTRATKRERGERELFFDWDYLYEIGNLEQTALSNSRMAKAKMRIKMDNLKAGKIIERCEEQLIGMTVIPSKNKKKIKRKFKKHDREI